MKSFLLAFSLIMSSVGIAQLDSLLPANLLPSSYDSVHGSLWDMYFKELSILNADGTIDIWDDREITQANIKDADVKLLLDGFYNAESYTQNRAMLYHYNLVFEFYKDSKVVVRIEISTMTGNIDIENTSNDLSFRNMCSSQLGEIILKVISKYGFMEFLDEIEVEGISEREEE